MNDLPIIELEVIATHTGLFDTLEATLKTDPSRTVFSFNGHAHGALLISTNEALSRVKVRPFHPEIQPDTHKVILSLGMYGLRAGVYENKDAEKRLARM